jgi:hypothetical protein
MFLPPHVEAVCVPAAMLEDHTIIMQEFQASTADHFRAVTGASIASTVASNAAN